MIPHHNIPSMHLTLICHFHKKWPSWNTQECETYISVYTAFGSFFRFHCQSVVKNSQQPEVRKCYQMKVTSILGKYSANFLWADVFIASFISFIWYDFRMWVIMALPNVLSFASLSNCFHFNRTVYSLNQLLKLISLFSTDVLVLWVLISPSSHFSFFIFSSIFIVVPIFLKDILTCLFCSW